MNNTLNLNEITISTFESDYLKKYLTNIGYKFTLEEMITIIFNSNLTVEEKFNIIDKIKDKDRVAEFQCNDYDSLIKEIDIMHNDLKYIKECLMGKHNSIITFFDELEDTKCVLSFAYATKLMQELNIKKYNSINIVNGEDSSNIAYVEINENYEIIDYTLCKPINNYISKLYTKYIDIPNDIKIGDIVKVVDDTEEYVVIADSKIPDNLKDGSDYTTDVSITIVPRLAFDQSEDFIKQIEDIRKNRIKNVDNNEQELDILLTEHEHVHLSLVEKIGD